MEVARLDYIEETPGNDWDMYCSKGQWEFDPYEDDRAKFAACLETAQTCKHWELRKELT